MKTAIRLMSMLLSIVMLLSIATVMPFSVSANSNSTTFEYGGYTVKYDITNSWNNGKNNNVTVTITNTGVKTIENWMLAYDFMGTITMQSGGTIFEKDGITYVKNTGTNLAGYGDSMNINSGMSVNFSYSLTNPTGTPDFFTLCQERVSLEQGVYYNVRMNPQWDYGTSFQGQILVENLTDKPIECWELTFSSANFTLQNSWERTLIDLGNGRYTIKPIDGNIFRISPNSTLTLGFQANKDINLGFADLEITFEGLTEVVFEDATSTSDEYPLIISDEELLEYVSNNLELEFSAGDYEKSVIKDIYFPVDEFQNVTISWVSSNPNIISDNGTVNRPNSGTETVIINATITTNSKGLTRGKSFKLVVYGLPTYSLDELVDYTFENLVNLNNGELPEYRTNEYERIKNFYGKFSDLNVRTVEDALYSLYNVKSLTGIADPLTELRAISVLADEYGTIYKFEQHYKGIPIFGSIFTVSVDVDGEVSFLLSDYTPISLDLSIIPTLTFQQAKATISGMNLNITMHEILSDENVNDRLFIYGNEDGIHLAWDVYFTLALDTADVEAGNYEGLVDAHSGELLYINPTEIYKENDCRSFMPDLDGTSRLIPMTYYSEILPGDKSDRNILRDMNRKISIYRDSSKDPIFTLGHDDQWQPDEISAMYNMVKTYNYYKDNFDRKSYNNKKSEIKIYLDSSVQNNAYWNGTMHLGIGTSIDRRNISYAVALDTIGHEFTHGVVASETKLDKYYCATPGAINEGYADIFSNYIDDTDWSHGNHIMVSGVGYRNLMDPNASRQPAQVGDSFYQDYKTDSSDRYGVHQNSSLFPYAAYLMQHEGDNSMTGIDILSQSQTQKIWYRSLCLGYTSTADFYDVRLNVIKSAKDIKCFSFEIKNIERIFDEIGITEVNCKEGKDYAKQLKKFSKSLKDSDTNENQVRIVLTWGAKPFDLDSHLYGPNNSGGEFHVYYDSKSYSYDEIIIANLDLDNTRGYGPETTTIYNPINGTHSFSVYNYSGSPSIASSGALVQVYIGNSSTPSYTFKVPTTIDGRTWNVFEYNSYTKTVTSVNTIT